MKKRIGAKIMAVMMAVVMMVAFMPSTAKANGLCPRENRMVKIEARHGQYIHADRTTTSTKIGSLLRGYTRIIRDYVDGWLLVDVKCNDTTQQGWIEYLPSYQLITAETEPTPTADVTWRALSNKNAVCLEPGALNIHTLADLKASVITTLPGGAQVKAVAMDKSKKWVEVGFYHGGLYKTGFVVAKDVKLVASNGKFKMSTKSTSVKRKKTKLLYVKGCGNITQFTKITWKTSRKKIATVNKYGLVTGKKKGKVTITAKVKFANVTKTLKTKVKVK